MGFIIAYQFVDPAPPKTITLATGSESGAYHGFAGQYRRILARDGITLNIRATLGSVENLALLRSGAVDLALVQGGTIGNNAKGALQSLGSLFLEPVWVFTARGIHVRRLSDFKSKRVAIGPVGSGTRALAITLLAANGINAENTTLMAETSDPAVDGLLAGAMDAAIFVASPQALYIKRLLSAGNIGLMSFGRAQAYEKLYPYLRNTQLHQGMAGLPGNIPPQNTQLLAAVASLVARDDLNPNLIPVILSAVTHIHRKGALFEAPGEFPTAKFSPIKVNEDARRYLEDGPSYLYRVLPFAAASLVDRIKIMVLPLITLLFPLFKIAPPIYRWRIRSKIYRWYAVVREIDCMALAGDFPEGLDREIARLRQVEQDVAHTTVPLSYMEEQYH
ncbi:MAG: TAXI family TRAP transporter solute-binding subunit, partial [Alphaproteobacteria bacterium]